MWEIFCRCFCCLCSECLSSSYSLQWTYGIELWLPFPPKHTLTCLHKQACDHLCPVVSERQPVAQPSPECPKKPFLFPRAFPAMGAEDPALPHSNSSFSVPVTDAEGICPVPTSKSPFCVLSVPLFISSFYFLA